MPSVHHIANGGFVADPRNADFDHEDAEIGLSRICTLSHFKCKRNIERLETGDKQGASIELLIPSKANRV